MRIDTEGEAGTPLTTPLIINNNSWKT